MMTAIVTQELVSSLTTVIQGLELRLMTVIQDMCQKMTTITQELEVGLM